MLKPALPVNESQRLAALHRLQILDTPPEPAFDDLTMLASAICGTARSALTLIDAERQWFKSACGAELGQTPRSTSFCAHAILEPEHLLLVEDALQDLRFHDNPVVTGTPPVRFYAGAPLVSHDGFVLGALCVFDSRPAALSEAQRAALMALSRQVSHLLQLRSAGIELERQLREREWYEQQLASYQAQLEAINADLTEQAHTDALTGLPNRRAFGPALAARHSEAELGQRPLSVAMLDIDHFKAINDLHGHDVGDQVLVELAGFLRRRLDGVGSVARLGGEEFALLLPGLALEQALGYCERLGRDIAHWPVRCPVTVSIGVAEVLAGENSEQALKRADLALYEAKRTGRDRVVAAR